MFNILDIEGEIVSFHLVYNMSKSWCQCQFHYSCLSLK